MSSVAATKAFLALLSEGPSSDPLKEVLLEALSDPQFVADRLGLGGRIQGGGGVMVLCPWHHESRPSCSLTVGAEGTLRAKCFACGVCKDVFSLIAAVQGLDDKTQFRSVLRAAMELAGMSPETTLQELERRSPRRQRKLAPPAFAPVEPLPIGLEERAFAHLVEQILAFGVLDGGPVSAEVCAYLERRHLLDVARAEGWVALPAPRSPAAAWCRRQLIDAANRIERRRGVPRSVVDEELYTIVTLDGPEFVDEEHRLVIPYRAPDGTVYTWQRRSLDDREDKYKFPRSWNRRTGKRVREGWGRGARWPYGIERLATAAPDAPITYTEGPLDAGAKRLMNAAAGRTGVVLGVPGTQAWRPFFATFARGRIAFVATDADRQTDPKKRDWGEEAAQRWGADLWRAGAREVVRERPERAKDWSEALARALSEEET